MTLNEVLKNTNYDVSLFSEEARKYVEDAIVVKTIRGKESLFIKCLKRDKEIALKPEEAVRQLYLYKLIHEYGYPTSRMDTQKEIAAKVQEAFTLRKQSKQLLEYAKQAVEMAIEQGEDVALAWLKDKIPVEV